MTRVAGACLRVSAGALALVLVSLALYSPPGPAGQASERPELPQRIDIQAAPADRDSLERPLPEAPATLPEGPVEFVGPADAQPGDGGALDPELRLRLLHEHRHVRRTAAREARDLGPQALAVLPELMTAYERSLEPRDWNTRTYVIETIGTIGPPAADAAPLLAHAVVEDPTSTVRRQAARALGRLGVVTPETVAALAQAAADDRQAANRVEAIEALAALVPMAPRNELPGLVAALVGALQEERVYYGRAAAAQALGTVGPSALELAAAPALVAALADGYPTVRNAAVDALGRLGPGARTLLPELEQLRAENERNSTGRAAAAAIDRIRQAEGVTDELARQPTLEREPPVPGATVDVSEPIQAQTDGHAPADAVMSTDGDVDPPFLEVYAPGRTGPREAVRYYLPGRTAPIEVSYEIIDGYAIAEGDIILGRADELAHVEQQRATCSGDLCEIRQPLMVRTGESFRWPGGVIPYELDRRFSQTMRFRIREAIDHLHEHTNLLIVERTGERDYVYIENVAQGCFAHAGRRGRRQVMGLENRCQKGSIIHEFLHTAGVWHEQSRTDRDNHIRILWANIEEGKEHNFSRHDRRGLDVGPYDYGSLMHYGSTAFGTVDPDTRRPRTTIEVIAAGNEIGQRDGLSEGDIRALASIYQGQDCVPFSPTTASATRLQGRWRIVDGANWLFDFGDVDSSEREARRSLAIIRHFGMDRVCFVGRPQPSATYLLVRGRAPAGSMNGEDCIRFRPDDLRVAEVRRFLRRTEWFMYDGDRPMIRFPNAAEAYRALDFIMQHGFRQQCFVGRPDPSFRYFRR